MAILCLYLQSLHCTWLATVVIASLHPGFLGALTWMSHIYSPPTSVWVSAVSLRFSPKIWILEKFTEEGVCHHFERVVLLLQTTWEGCFFASNNMWGMSCSYLFVKGEVSDVDIAGCGEDAPRLPVHQTVVRDENPDLLKLLDHLIRPAEQNNRKCKSG